MKNEFSEIRRLAAAFASFCRAHNLSRRVLSHVTMVMGEVVSNVIKYGYADNSSHEITVRFALSGDEVICEIEDDGKHFNLIESPLPDISRIVTSKNPRGLGIPLIREFSDSLVYRRKQGTNVLTISKFLTGTGPTAVPRQ